MNSSDIDNIFNSFKSETDFSASEFHDRLQSSLEKLFLDQYQERTLLGIDIYKYSKMDLVPQTLVPYMFKNIYDVAVSTCIDNESLFFAEKSYQWFKDHFIDTGDGGFQIFDNPFQALIFCIHFQSVMRVFNTGTFIPLASMAIGGPITARYVITNDNILSFNENYYGPLIINNARILSCDKLNRLLIDESTYQWFLLNINGIETLQYLTIEDLKKLKNPMYSQVGKSMVIKSPNTLGVLRADIQQIENLSVKEELHKVFSIHLQVALNKTTFGDISKLVVSIGNLNSLGL